MAGFGDSYSGTDALSRLRHEVERLGIDPRDWFADQKGRRRFRVRCIAKQAWLAGWSSYKATRFYPLWNIHKGDSWGTAQAARRQIDRITLGTEPSDRYEVVEFVEFEIGVRT